MQAKRDLGFEMPEGYCAQADDIGCKYPQPILIPEHREVFTVFSRVRTQVVPAPMGGLIGFDYERCAKTARAYGYDFWDPEFLDLFQIVEDEFVEATNARIKAASKVGAGSNTQG